MSAEIQCPVCGKGVEVHRGIVEDHEEPVHIVPNKAKTIGVYVRCGGSGARVEVYTPRAVARSQG